MVEVFMRLSKDVERQLDTVSVAFNGNSHLGGTFTPEALGRVEKSLQNGPAILAPQTAENDLSF